MFSLLSAALACGHQEFAAVFQARFNHSYASQEALDAAVASFCANLKSLRSLQERGCASCVVTGAMDQNFSALYGRPALEARKANKALRSQFDAKSLEAETTCQQTICYSERWFQSDLAPYSSLDLREAGLVAPKARNQLSFGTCYAHVAVSLLESAVLRSAKHLRENGPREWLAFDAASLDLSEQFLMVNDHGAGGYDVGGFVQTSLQWHYVKNEPIELEANFPYDPDKYKDLWEGGGSLKAKETTPFYRPYEVYPNSLAARVPAEEAYTPMVFLHQFTPAQPAFNRTVVEKIKQALSRGFPIALAMNIAESNEPLQAYGPDSGVVMPGTLFYSECVPLSDTDAGANHVVELIGYGTSNRTPTGETVDVWLVRQSWGDDWGNEGCFTVQIGSNSHCIEQEAYFIVSKDYDERRASRGVLTRNSTSLIDADQPMCAEDAPYFQLEPQQKCLTACENSAMYAEPDKLCTDSCTFGAFERRVSSVQGGQELFCVTRCPQKHTEKPDGQWECSEACALFSDSGKCVGACASNAYDLETKECTAECPGLHVKNEETGALMCVPACASPHAFRNGKECRKACPFFTADATPETYVCVESCAAANAPYYSQTSEGVLCLGSCALYVESDGQCSSECRSGAFKESAAVNVCVESCAAYFIPTGTQKKCVDACGNSSYADGQRCVEKCPENLFVQRGFCVDACASGFYTSDERGLFCAERCEKLSAPGIGNSSVCVSSCQAPWDKIDVTGHSCVDSCTFYSLEQTGKRCTTECTTAYVPTESQTDQICIASCPGAAPLIAEKKCTEACPKELPFVSENSTCLRECQRYQQTENALLCLSACPSRYITHKENGTVECLDRCPEKYSAVGDMCTNQNLIITVSCGIVGCVALIVAVSLIACCMCKRRPRRQYTSVKSGVVMSSAVGGDALE